MNFVFGLVAVNGMICSPFNGDIEILHVGAFLREPPEIIREHWYESKRQRDFIRSLEHLMKACRRESEWNELVQEAEWREMVWYYVDDLSLYSLKMPDMDPTIRHEKLVRAMRKLKSLLRESDYLSANVPSPRMFLDLCDR